MLELAARVEAPEPWRRVIVEVGETVEEVRAREGIGPNENVIARVIVEPSDKIRYVERPEIGPEGASGWGQMGSV